MAGRIHPNTNLAAATPQPLTRPPTLRLLTLHHLSAARGATTFQLAGRVIRRRKIRNAILLWLRDRSGTVPLCVRADPPETHKACRAILESDIGDIVSVTGYISADRDQRLVLEVSSGQLLSKALQLNYGLLDAKPQSRRRELELMASEKHREQLRLRAALVCALRAFMDGEEFTEVETPVLQTLAGGALARPFLTYCDARDSRLSLRLSAQLYLRRCTVGDLERVYDLGKRFRNEGVSPMHSPEFAMLEWAMSYSDCHDAANFAERLIVAAATRVLDRLHIQRGGTAIDLSPPWRRVTLQQTLLESIGLNILSASREEMAAALPAHQGHIRSWCDAVQLLYRTHVESRLIQPTIIYDFPLDAHPCVIQHRTQPRLGRHFDIVIGGVEIGSGGEDITDPDEQLRRFTAQRLARGRQKDSEPHQSDLDYVDALRYGAPPASGAGIGIDRLLMVLLETRAVHETATLPLV